MLTLTVNGSWTQFVKPLKDMTDFNTHGALKGRKGPATSYGRLPAFMHHLASQAEYVAYSYDTPIAWHIPGMTLWITPGVLYGVTTSKHQGRIFTALSQLDVWDGDKSVNERGWENLPHA